MSYVQSGHSFRSMCLAIAGVAKQSETKSYISYCATAKSHIIHMGTHEHKTISSSLTHILHFCLARFIVNITLTHHQHDHGRRKGRQRGTKPPLDFEIISTKTLFFRFRRVKNKFHHFWPPPGKNFGKIPYWPPPGKNLSNANEHDNDRTSQGIYCYPCFLAGLLLNTLKLHETGQRAACGSRVAGWPLQRYCIHCRHRMKINLYLNAF